MSSSASSADFTISQRVVAERMREIVFSKAVAQRIVEVCGDFAVDEEKLSGERDAVMSIAKTQFRSGQEFMDAAGINKKAEMGEDMRRYFSHRGLKWDSSSAEYCELANSLSNVQAPISIYLRKR